MVKGNLLTESTICSPRIHVNYQAESFNIISHILAVLKISISDMTVSGYVGSLNVCSEGTSLSGCRVSIRGLVVSLQLLRAVIQGSALPRIFSRDGEIHYNIP